MNGLCSGRWAVGMVADVMLRLLAFVRLCVQAQDAAKAPAGAAIFAKKCVLCHGADGTGNTPLGKQLAGGESALESGAEAGPMRSCARIVHDGQTNMPPFGDQLTDDEIDQVIQYVRTFAAPVKAAKKQ